MDNLLTHIHLLILLIIILIARYFLVKARKHLSVEQKAKLLDIFSGKAYIIYTCVIIGLFIVLLLPGNIDPGIALIAIASYLAFTVITAIVYTTWMYQRMKAVGLPKKYTDVVLFWNVFLYLFMIGFLIYVFVYA